MTSLLVNKVHLLLFAVGVALYVNTLPGELLFDDNEAIVTNRDVRPSTPLKFVFIDDFWGVPVSSNDSHKSYRPLTVLSFRLNFALHGLHPWGYHLINVFLHGLVSALFFDVSVLVFDGDIAPAAAGSLLFAVHPIHTEAVSSVVGRAELLAALFYLLSFQCYVKATHQSKDFPPENFSYGFLGMAVILCGISTLCKETGITVLASCATYDLVYACHLSGRDVLYGVTRLWVTYPKWVRSLLIRMLLLSAALGVFLILRIGLLAGGAATSFVESDNPTLFEPNSWTRLRTYIYLCALNVWAMLCPSALCYDWSMDSILRLKDNTDPRNLITVAMAIALSSLVYYGLFSQNHPMSQTRNAHASEAQASSTAEWEVSALEKSTSLNRNGTASGLTGNGHVPVQKDEELCDAQKSQAVTKRRRVLTMALCLMVAPFIPASNLFFPVGFVVAERVLYLPSMGYCLVIGLALRVFMRNQSTCSMDDKVAKPWVPQFRLPPALSVLFCGLLLVCSSKTFVRNFDWLSTEALANAGLRNNPGNAKIHLTMGNVLANKGLRKCEHFYRRALQLRPHYTAAWTNLGLVLLNTERPKEAEEAYLEAIRLKPDSADANTNMGHLCRIQQRWSEADEHYRMALKKRPHDTILNYNIGFVNEKLDKLKVTEMHYRHVLAVEPNNADAGFALAYLLATTSTKHTRLNEGHLATGKRFKQAEKAYHAALHYSQNNADGWLLLGKLLLWNEQIDQAELQLRQAIRINPELVEAHHYLGQALEKKGLVLEATRAYNVAIQLDRNYQPALQSVKQLEKSQML